MPLKSTGNIISRIKYNKKNVSLFFNKDKVNISFDAYSLNYLYVGKILSRKEIHELIDTISQQLMKPLKKRCLY